MFRGVDEGADHFYEFQLSKHAFTSAFTPSFGNRLSVVRAAPKLIGFYKQNTEVRGGGVTYFRKKALGCGLKDTISSHDRVLSGSNHRGDSKNF